MALRFLNSGYFAGKVGIGTASPTATLTISSDVGADGSWNKSGILIENTSTTTGEPTLAFRNAGTAGTGANYWHTGLNQSNIYKLAYGTSFTDGNTKFELATDGGLRLNSYTQGFLQTDANGNVSTSGGGTLPGGPYLPLSAGSGFPLTGELYVNSNTYSQTYRSSRTDGEIYIQATTANDFVSIGTQVANNLMRIQGNGNVGIGTANPQHGLDVYNNSDNKYVARFTQDHATGYGILIDVDSTSNNDPALWIKNAATTSMWVGSGGNVGIGTTNPSDLLTVNGNSRVVGVLKVSDGTANAPSIAHRADENTGIFFPANDVIGLTTSSAERMRIDSAGNVGIGTTAPTAKLDVNGAARAGGKLTYSISAGSLDTTGYAVAGLTIGWNGNSAGFAFTCFGGAGYQKVIYSCKNVSGSWVVSKDIDEGVNALDVVASVNATTITFTFKARTSNQNYTPRVTVEAFGHSINTTYL